MANPFSISAQNRTLPIRLWLILGFCVFVAACQSSNSQLNVRHSLFPFTTQSGQQTFDYTMTWYVPPAQLFGSERGTIIANMGLPSERFRSPRLSLDNETKIKLEDVAVKSLENELNKAEFCQQGYEIQSIKWLERAIHFSGICIQD